MSGVLFRAEAELARVNTRRAELERAFLNSLDRLDRGVLTEEEYLLAPTARRREQEGLRTLQAELEPSPFRPLSEAEIVRRHKQEQGEEARDEERFEDFDSQLESEIRDPALSRALDVLKALAVVRQIHPF